MYTFLTEGGYCATLLFLGCVFIVFIIFAAQIDLVSAENCFNNPACFKRQKQQQFPQMPMQAPGQPQQQQYPQQYPQQQYPQQYPQYPSGPQNYRQSQLPPLPYPLCVTQAGTCDTNQGYGSNCVCSD